MVTDTVATNSTGSSGSNIFAGILYGAAAGALWGLVFVAPQMTSAFSPVQLAAARYIAYGIFALPLVWPHWRRYVSILGLREWVALAKLSFLGNISYYVLLATSVQLSGVAMASLIIGFLPVVVTIIGSREVGAVTLNHLVPSLLMSAGGILCISWETLGNAPKGALSTQIIGLLCAFGALASWTAFAVSNKRWLGRLDRISGYDWSLLIGVVTGLQALIFVPPALLFARIDQTPLEWLSFASVAAGIAFLSSIVGNGLWNRMSQLLPLTMIGQMILFETLFALLYGFIWEERLPQPLEGVAIALVLGSVTSCLAAHRLSARRTGRVMKGFE